MSSKLEPVIWLRVLVTLAYMKGRTDVRTYVRMYVRTLYVRTDVHDVMAIKPNFLTSMGYHIFLTMVLRARGAPLSSFGLAVWYVIGLELLRDSAQIKVIINRSSAYLAALIIISCALTKWVLKEV